MKTESLSILAVALPLFVFAGGCAMDAGALSDAESVDEQSEALTPKADCDAVSIAKPTKPAAACAMLANPTMIYELSLPQAAFGGQTAYLVTEVDMNTWTVNPAQRVVWSTCPTTSPSKPGAVVALAPPQLAVPNVWDYSAWVGLSNPTLTGSIDPNCDVISSVSGQLDVRYALAQGATYTDACNVLANAGQPCVPCTDGVVACVDVKGNQQAGPVPGPVSPADVPSYVCQ